MPTDNENNASLLSERVLYVLERMQSGKFDHRAASFHFAQLDLHERVELLHALSACRRMSEPTAA